MKWRRGLALWAIIAIAVTSSTGCVPHACATAAQFPPGVWLDPSPWLAAHPGSALTACLDGNCKKADAATTAILQLTVPYRSPAPESDIRSHYHLARLGPTEGSDTRHPA